MTEAEEYKHIKYLEERVSELTYMLNEQKRKPLGQNTGITLIDCLNHYLTSCPISCKVTTWNQDYMWNLELSRNGAQLFEVKDAVNIQCCYEELLEFIITKGIVE